MAVGCCSSGGSHNVPGVNEAVELEHGHGHVDGDEVAQPACPEEGECCDDDTCSDQTGGLSTTLSLTLACCDSSEEHCDEKCIIAAAALECEKACEGDTVATQDGAATGSHDHAHDEDGHHPGTACNTHLAKAFDQYSAYLETARCICRGILERGWATTCCDKPPTSTKVPILADAFTTAHASEKKIAKHHHHGIKRRGKKAAALQTDMGIKHSRDADCCSGHDIEHSDYIEKGADTALSHRDIEKADSHETIMLSVDGMTCSGCGNKMERTLKAIPGISAVRVNFVMGHAEFSLDTSINNAEQVIRETQRATGFNCSKISNDDQTLDVLASGQAAKSLMDLPITGIMQATILDKQTVRFTYDPITIGARTLIEKIGPLSDGLAPPQDDPSVSSGRKRLYDQLFKTILAAVFTIPVLVLAWGETPVDEKTKSCVSMALATVVQLIAIPDFYQPAISALVHSGSIEMDMLVVISITAAYVYSVTAFAFRMAGHPLETAEFFETSTLLITLVILGRLVAAFARVRAVAAVSLRSLQASTAVLVLDGKDHEIDARLLQYGDKFKIGPHSTVPTDGIVTGGSSEVDESMLTGESVPVFKKQGDVVIAGTVNGSGTLQARLTRLPGKNTVTDIAQLVEEAANSKPKLQDIADRVASWFVPIVTSVAAVVVIVWLVVGLKVRNYGTGKAISNAITYAVATLAVSCPCALGLAVPMVLVVAGGIAARNGVIIKSAECTERARKVTDVVFDKTGTITEGELDVTVEEFFIADKDRAMAVAKALVTGNKHPVSLAVAKYLEQRATPEIKLTEVHVIPGAGVEAQLDDYAVRAGNPKWTATHHHPAVIRLQENGLTLLIISRDGNPLAVFGLRTRLRNEAAKVVKQLLDRGINIHLVSGDQKRAVESVASQVGISNVASQCTPTEKRDYVADLMSQGKNVMFVGDGTNDAVAVTQADVGVQLASAARILQGLSSAMTWTVGLALVIDTVDPKHVGRATGWVSIALSMGTLVGPMLGGIVYGNSGSYEVFYMCFGLIALDIILRLAIIETKEAKRWTDSCVDPVSVEGSDVSMAEHKSPASESIDANSAERGRVTLTPNNTSPPKTTTSSMLPFLRKPRLLAALWATLIEAVVMTSFDSTIPLFVSSTFGWDSIGAGLVFLPLVLPTFASPIAGALSDRYGPKWMATAGFLIVTPFLICLRFVEEDTLRHKIMLCGLLVGVGIGVTLVFSPVMVEISWAVEEDLDDDEPTAAPYALAYGLYNMAFSGGAILGPIMGGLIRERAGWATVGWTMGLISVVTAITQALWIGGSLTSRWQRKGTKA